MARKALSALAVAAVAAVLVAGAWAGLRSPEAGLGKVDPSVFIFSKAAVGVSLEA